MLAVVLAILLILGYGVVFLSPEIGGTNQDLLAFLQTTLQRLRAKAARVDYRRVSRREYCEATQYFVNGMKGERPADAKKWTLFLGHVVDLEGYSSVHPGGDILDRFVGYDMTPWMLITHSKSESALKTLVARCVAHLEGSPPVDLSSPFLSAIDQKYVQIFFKYMDDGKFAVPRSWVALDLMQTFGTYVVGMYYLFLAALLEGRITTWQEQVLGYTLLIMSGCRFGFFFHDVMHRSVFTSAHYARRFTYWASMLLWGFDFNAVGDVHDVHHAFVNILGMDTAIEIPLMSFDPRQPLWMSKEVAARWCVQNTLFYGVISFMLWPYYLLAPFVDSIMKISQYSNQSRRHTRRHFFQMALSLSRLFLMYFFWEWHFPIFIAVVCAFFVFAATGSLNHFHMPVLTPAQVFTPLSSLVESEPSRTLSTPFVVLQSQTIQNSHSSAVADDLLGHFTLHIEHHLFPMMPRRRYPDVSCELQALLEEFGLGYATCSQGEAIQKFNHIMRFPHEKAASPINT